MGLTLIGALQLHALHAFTTDGLWEAKEKINTWFRILNADSFYTVGHEWYHH